ncbi:MAG: metallophosphoesterase [Polyangia bacterium]
MRAAVAVAVLLALGKTATADAQLVTPPHLSELSPSGFSVLFETDRDVEASIELSRRDGAFSRAAGDRGRLHRIRVTGLSPLESVKYRVVVSGQVLATATARSGPSDGASALDFVVFGDTRGGRAADRACIDTARALNPALVVHTGDYVPVGGDERWWRAALMNESSLMQETPLYLAVGNHELLADPDALLARRFLAPPADGPMYYTFRVGPARFVVLDSSHMSPPQVAWLDKALTAASKEVGRPHVFVFLHHPPYSTGDHCGSASQQRGMLEVLSRHKPSAVFAGHDHAYERLEAGGIRYFVSGGGGAPLYASSDFCSDEDKRALKVYRAEYHILRVRVRGAGVEVEVLRPGESDIETVRWKD